MSEAYKVGDTAYVRLSGMGVPRKGTVTGVTPSGQVVVQYETGSTDRFRNRQKIGGSVWDGAWLVSEADYLEEVAEHRERDARAKMRHLAEEIRWRTADRAELLAAIDGIRTLIETLPETQS